MSNSHGPGGDADPQLRLHSEFSLDPGASVSQTLLNLERRSASSERSVL
jgi:hypothetical protein